MTELLFHTPWWLPTSIIAVGIVLFLSGNKRTIRPLTRAGMIIAGLGMLLGAVSWLVDTDIEKVTDRSRALVKAAEQQDWPAMQNLLAADVRFTYPTVQRSISPRDELMEAARTTIQAVGLQSAYVTSLSVEAFNDEIKSGMRIFTDTQKLAGQQVPSDWTLRWKKVDGKWVVSEIRLDGVGDVSPEAVKQQLPK